MESILAILMLVAMFGVYFFLICLKDEYDTRKNKKEEEKERSLQREQDALVEKQKIDAKNLAVGIEIDNQYLQSVKELKQKIAHRMREVSYDNISEIKAELSSIEQTISVTQRAIESTLERKSAMGGGETQNIIYECKSMINKLKSTHGGYVYVLTNPAMPGLVKIGKTERNPKDRAAELSTSTGVPARYSVYGSLWALDFDDLEKRVHRKLSPKRFNQDREFFEIEPEQALGVVNALALKG
jgi:type III secretory pathway component EscV